MSDLLALVLGVVRKRRVQISLQHSTSLFRGMSCSSIDVGHSFQEEIESRTEKQVSIPYTAHAIFVFSVSMYAEPFAWLIRPVFKTTHIQ